MKEDEWNSVVREKKNKDTYDWILMIDGSPEYGLYVYNVVSGGGFYKEKPKRDKWTNNQAEYKALIFALEYHVAYGESAIIFSDSQLVVRQFSEEYACRESELQILLGQVRQTIRIKKQNIDLKYIPREKNLAGFELEKIRRKKKNV